MGCSLVRQPPTLHHWRVSCGAGVLRVSSKLGSSHRTLTTPVEAYAPPCPANIRPVWRRSTKLSAPRFAQLSPLQPSASALNSTLLLIQPRLPAHEVPLPQGFSRKR